MKKKNIILYFMAFIFLLTIESFFLTANAQETITENGFEIDAGSGEILNYSGEQLILEIPAEVSGVSVKSVSEKALFMWLGTKLTIPDCIEKIGEGAFSDCPFLEQIEVSEENEYYSSQEGVLFNKEKSVLIKYPDSKSGTSYTVPEGVEEIKIVAFNGSLNLKEIIIPETVNITTGCFGGVAELEKIIVDGNNPYITSADGVLFDKKMEVLLQYPKRKAGGQYIIPDGVKIVGTDAFLAAYDLESIIVPDSVIDYMEGAFFLCSIKEISIPEEMTVIREGTFAGTSIVELAIPENIEKIESRAFSECINLVSITIPQSVLFIGERCFDGCMSLQSIEIPEKITKIEKGTFSYCCNLSKIVFPDELDTIGEDAFLKTGFETFDMPNSVVEIGDRSFGYCENLIELRVSEKVESIGEEMFSNCYNLQSIYIPENVKYISDNAFSNRSKDLTIYGSTGSYAEGYAETYGIGFIDKSGKSPSDGAAVPDDSETVSSHGPLFYIVLFGAAVLFVAAIIISTFILRKKNKARNVGK